MVQVNGVWLRTGGEVPTSEGSRSYPKFSNSLEPLHFLSKGAASPEWMLSRSRERLRLRRRRHVRQPARTPFLRA
jgi:hypothetical protein